MVCDQYSLDQLGVKFEVKLIDCESDTPFDTGDIVSQTIVFYKPDGTKFSKVATLVEDLPDNPGEFLIQYINTTPEESILDLIGSWEYAGAAILTTGDNLQSSQRKIFWVS